MKDQALGTLKRASEARAYVRRASGSGGWSALCGNDECFNRFAVDRIGYAGDSDLEDVRVHGEHGSTSSG